MNKKIASELAIGITLLLAIIVGAIFLVQDMQQDVADNSAKIDVQQPVKRSVEKPAAEPIGIPAVDEKQTKDSQQSQDTACIGRLFEGEAMIKGTYALTTIPGTTKKDWMFKVIKEDIEKLPAQAKTENGDTVNDLLFISDATPEMTVKLKKATEAKPETIIIKGIYLDCEGVPVVSIEPARIALAKYLKKL